MASKRRTKEKYPRTSDLSTSIEPRSLPKQTVPRLAILITLTAITVITIAAYLHSFWAPIPWLIGIVAWAYYFWPERVERYPSLLEPAPVSYGQLLFVLGAAALLRLYKIDELPLGSYVDEILTLNNSLALLEQPFDFFGQRPLAWQGWVQTTNLYLYFDLVILKLFGVSYWSMKLLSVIPGIIACGAVFLICQLLFDKRVALCTSLLFACAHWTVRLSRYGWDVAFMIMTFSLALWLLLLAAQRGRPLYGYFSGLIAGLCLYSYLGSRVCLLSLVIFWTLEWSLTRQRPITRLVIAFAIGATITAFPLLFYYLENPNAFWVRLTELNVFNDDHPFITIVGNIWRHALMFFTFGGTYARDNFPGLPMMDPLTALLFIIGIAVLVSRRKNFSARLIACTLVINFTSGVLSISPEGAPYVYRTAAVMIPAFLIVGFGLQGLMDYFQTTRHVGLTNYLKPAAVFVLVLIISLNIYFYFGLEPKNIAAMRVMVYESRLIGLEIARDNIPAILIGGDILDPSNADPRAGEKYPYANPPPLFPPAIRHLAMVNFSGRYDLNRSVSHNLARPKNIYFIDYESLKSNISALPPPAKIIFRSREQALKEMIRANYPKASLKDIRDVSGDPIFVVAILPGSAAVSADTAAGH